MRESVEVRIGQRLQETGLPGVSYAVVMEDKLACCEAIGVADKTTGERLTNGHLLQACSISKFISAIIALRVAEIHKLNLDDDINNYLTSWQMPHKDDANAGTSKPVSLRSLLCHQAGLLDPEDSFDSLTPEETVPTLSEILTGQTRLHPQPVVPASTPYDSFAYSDAGYCVIEQVLQDVTGTSFALLANRYLFAHLDFDASECRFEQPLRLDAFQQIVAKGHTPSGEVLAVGEPVYPYLAAAGLWCTASAYAGILLEVIRAAKGRGRVLTPVIVNDLLAEPGARYIGLGNFSSGSAKNPFVYHQGWGKGFQCEFRLWPEEASGCIVMINANPGVEQSESLVGETITLLMDEFALGR